MRTNNRSSWSVDWLPPKAARAVSEILWPLRRMGATAGTRVLPPGFGVRGPDRAFQAAPDLPERLPKFASLRRLRDRLEKRCRATAVQNLADFPENLSEARPGLLRCKRPDSRVDWLPPKGGWATGTARAIFRRVNAGQPGHRVAVGANDAAASIVFSSFAKAWLFPPVRANADGIVGGWRAIRPTIS